MKRRCLLRRRWPWLGLLMVPALAWALLLAVVPTDWARAKLVDRLARATGRSVRIGALRLGLTGDLRVLDLAIAEPATPADPWLEVAEARIDVHLGQVLRGHCEPGEVRVSGATLRVWRKSDGSFEFGDLLRDPVTPRFEAELRTAAVEIDRGMPVLGFFVPVVAGTTEGVGGKVDLLLALKGRGNTRDEIRRTLAGHGSIALDPIDLDGSKFLAELDVLGECPEKSRIGSVAADFRVEGGRIATDELTIRLSRFPFVLGGWTDFDGHFDYAARVDRIADKLPKEAKGWISELKVNFDQLAGLRMKGSIDRVEVTVHGHPLTGDPGSPDDERAKFRDTARRIRDRFFR